MEYQAKIVQIIKEEEYKKFGFIKYSNHDYLNLMPLELWNEKQRKINKVLQRISVLIVLLGVGILLIYGVLFFAISYKNDYPAIWPLALILVAVVFFNIYDSYRKKKVFNKYWYFDTPLPVEKPHNLKVGDVINILVNFNKKE